MNIKTLCPVLASLHGHHGRHVQEYKYLFLDIFFLNDGFVCKIVPNSIPAGYNLNLDCLCAINIV